MTTIEHGYPAELALQFEEEPGAMAAWLTAEGAGAARRMAFVEAEPTFIRGAASVENAEHQAHVDQTPRPLQGLETADGGSITAYLHGAEVATADGQQLVATWQGRLLAHALGGGARGYRTTIAVVTDQTHIEVTSATGIAVGHMLALASTADPTRCHVVQVLEVSGVAITIDREVPWTLAADDVVHPCEMAWRDPDGVGTSTIAGLWRRASKTWAIRGGHLSLDSLTLDRGGHPVLGFGVMGGRGSTPGHALTPAWPAFTVATQGRSRTLPIGRDTKLFLQEKGTATWSLHHVWSLGFTPGVSVVANDTVTEVDTHMQGRAGYRAERGDTQLEVDVKLDPVHYEKWVAGTAFTATYMQVAPAGHGWALHMRECFLAESPELVAEGSLLYKLRLRATVDESATTAALRAKIQFARF